MQFTVSVKRTGSPSKNKASSLLKEATALKNDGNINQAIKKLEDAYIEISKTGIDFTIDTFLRLPLYLQASGQDDEAWREFNILLTHGYPNMPEADWAWHQMESKILDKMRLSLQRRKSNLTAISFGISSFIADLRAEHEKPRSIKDEEYLSRSTTKEHIEGVLIPLLKKAKCVEALNKSVSVVLQWVNALPECDNKVYTKNLNEAIQSAPRRAQ